MPYSNIESAAYRCKDYDKVFEAVMNILPLEEDTLKEIEGYLMSMVLSRRMKK